MDKRGKKWVGWEGVGEGGERRQEGRRSVGNEDGNWGIERFS